MMKAWLISIVSKHIKVVIVGIVVIFVDIS